MKTESCEIRIRGMICRSCTDEVSGMLLRTKGVVKATVSYRKALAEVSYDPALVTPDELESRIKSLGYDTGERSRAERLLDLGCAALTVLLVWLLLRWGGASPKIGGGSFGALFLVGLSTSPHCLGMCGGILLSACHGGEGRKAQLGAALGYNGGRMISYTRCSSPCWDLSLPCWASTCGACCPRCRPSPENRTRSAVCPTGSGVKRRCWSAC